LVGLFRKKDNPVQEDQTESNQNEPIIEDSKLSNHSEEKLKIEEMKESEISSRNDQI